MIYIRVKYTMQHEENKKNQKNPASSIFGKWANKTWTHTRKRPTVSLTGCPEVRFDIELPQYIDSCSRDTLSQENLKNLYHVMSSKTNQPWCLFPMHFLPLITFVKVETVW